MFSNLLHKKNHNNKSPEKISEKPKAVFCLQINLPCYSFFSDNLKKGFRQKFKYFFLPDNFP